MTAVKVLALDALDERIHRLVPLARIEVFQVLARDTDLGANTLLHTRLQQAISIHIIYTIHTYMHIIQYMPHHLLYIHITLHTPTTW